MPIGFARIETAFWQAPSSLPATSLMQARQPCFKAGMERPFDPIARHLRFQPASQLWQQTDRPAAFAADRVPPQRMAKAARHRPPGGHAPAANVMDEVAPGGAALNPGPGGSIIGRQRRADLLVPMPACTRGRCRHDRKPVDATQRLERGRFSKRPRTSRSIAGSGAVLCGRHKLQITHFPARSGQPGRSFLRPA